MDEALYGPRKITRYPYDIWSDGGFYELEKGVDFDCEIEQLRSVVSNHNKAHPETAVRIIQRKTRVFVTRKRRSP